jgi:hypothetical protein
LSLARRLALVDAELGFTGPGEAGVRLPLAALEEVEAELLPVERDRLFEVRDGHIRPDASVGEHLEEDRAAWGAESRAA